MNRIKIVGGGLAGLSLGIALRNRGVPATIHEATTYPRHRVCGEFINGVTAATLERLGIAKLLSDARLHRTTAWFLKDEVAYEATLAEPAIGLSRFVLDERLAREFVSLGGELRTRSRLEPHLEAGLVCTNGRKRERRGEWMGLKVHVDAPDQFADLEMHIGEAGYVGLAPVENGRANVCGLFRRRHGVKGKGVDLLFQYLAQNSLNRFAGRLRKVEFDATSFAGVSAFRLGRQKRVPGSCDLGDAESMIPPFTGNGMSMAFEAAEVGVAPLYQYSSGRSSWTDAVRSLRTSLRSRFRSRLVAARLLHPFLFSEAGRRLFALAASRHVLPFGLMFRLLR